ncbi:F0F1 ATP synthase subunit delta [Bombilactobacillus folatiphilus]|uniref:ATP synthase subunit delta n=1 Tax=Bombilactobacillus folatiphilus TaxID=2923362 RepID=A0ABY4PAG8_9LACO|nr:ATP synthase F1 subunit delta [Bombilactobacillus folatiphilus]UQS82673.1 F0F1 ATP synthase subunit delta [Bombilactobacillus folatiphilus]
MKLNKDEIGRRYGRALFEFASEQAQQKAILDELVAIEQIYEQVPDLGNILTDARLSSLEKQSLLDLIQKNASSIMQHFLQLLFDYRRLDCLSAIKDFYQTLYDQADSIYDATVTSAIDLNTRQKNLLMQAIAQQFGAKKVRLEIQINPEIMGGLIIRVGDQIIDGSVASRLKKMSQALLNS